MGGEGVIRLMMNVLERNYNFSVKYTRMWIKGRWLMYIRQTHRSVGTVNVSSDVSE